MKLSLYAIRHFQSLKNLSVKLIKKGHGNVVRVFNPKYQTGNPLTTLFRAFGIESDKEIFAI